MYLHRQTHTYTDVCAQTYTGTHIHTFRVICTHRDMKDRHMDTHMHT